MDVLEEVFYKGHHIFVTEEMTSRGYVINVMKLSFYRQIMDDHVIVHCLFILVKMEEITSLSDYVL